MDIRSRSAALLSASALAAAAVLSGPVVGSLAGPFDGPFGGATALAQTQDRVDLQQIETVPAGPSDVTAGPDAGADAPAGEGTTEAGAKVDETVQAAERDPETGQVEAAEAGAGPTENWFGCKPSAEGKMDQCDKGAEQAEIQGASQ